MSHKTRASLHTHHITCLVAITGQLASGIIQCAHPGFRCCQGLIEAVRNTTFPVRLGPVQTGLGMGAGGVSLDGFGCRNAIALIPLEPLHTMQTPPCPRYSLSTFSADWGLSTWGRGGGHQERDLPNDNIPVLKEISFSFPTLLFLDAACTQPLTHAMQVCSPGRL